MKHEHIVRVFVQGSLLKREMCGLKMVKTSSVCLRSAFPYPVIGWHAFIVFVCVLGGCYHENKNEMVKMTFQCAFQLQLPT